MMMKMNKQALRSTKASSPVMGKSAVRPSVLMRSEGKAEAPKMLNVSACVLGVGVRVGA